MAQVPISFSSDERTYGGLTPAVLKNRFFEQNPATVGGAAMLARPGTDELGTWGDGPIRAIYSLPGLFDGALFFVSGETLYRRETDGSTIAITGTVYGTGAVSLTGVAGAGYEHLFIADGSHLQYYAGGAKATGTLTVSAQIAEGDVVQIGSTYYRWTATVGTGAGTSADPWDVLIGATALESVQNLVAAISFTGTAGTTYSSNLGGQNGEVTATVSLTTAATGTLTATANPEENDTLNIGGYYYRWTATVGSGAGTLSDPWDVLIGASTTDSLSNMAAAINATGTPGTTYSTELTTAHPLVSAASDATTLTVTETGDPTDGTGIATTLTSDNAAPVVSWGAATLVQATGAAAVAVTARTDLAAGNDIATTETAANASWGGVTLTGGGVHALSGVTVPDGLPPIFVVTLKSYVIVAIGNSDTFYWIEPAAVVIDALDFATAESQPDDVLALAVVGDTVWFIGDGSTEVWYPTGGDPPFSPVSGRVYDRGAVAGTVVNVKGVVFLVGPDNVVYAIGGSATRVSNHGVEQMIREQLGSE